MKLDTAQIEVIRKETGIQPIPKAEPSYNRLEDNFGEHTFYVDSFGLYVWEACQDSEGGRTEVMALQIASWVDDDMTTLQVHPPKATGKVIVLEALH